MEIADDALVLSSRRFGENDAIVSLLTRDHGRLAGLARGGAGKRGAALWQPGMRVAGRWRARLADQLGVWTAEPAANAAAPLLAEPGALAALASACALLDATLTERDPHPGLFDESWAMMTALGEGGWLTAYPRWELALLAHLGFGLDLSVCAATGTTDDLIYVSPKSGRAVSASAGAPYAARMLPLPAFLRQGGEADAAAAEAALRLTGFFLEREAFAPLGKAAPAARERLVDRLAGVATRCNME